jgi:L-2,4-diaminobutyrate decarboxylase
MESAPPHAAPAPALEEFRRTGHALVDRMVDYLAGIEERPVSPPLDPGLIARDFDEVLPRSGLPAAQVWEETWERVAHRSIHLAHPMYMGHQVAPPLPQAVLADALTSLLNQSVAVREMSPTGTFVEAQVVRWMVELLGYPPEADGTLVSGGSAANLTGLLAARAARFPQSWSGGAGAGEGIERAVVLVSPQAHYSIERAAGVMGLGSRAVHSVEARGEGMDPAALWRALEALRAAGRPVLAVVATAGSTATGSFDELEAIAELCRESGVWLHVDAAHGGSFLASPVLRKRLRGIERADSVSWDPHKMMFMPISAGAVLVRDHRHLDAAFSQSAPYLFHPRPGETRSSDTGQRTLQCSRRLDALKIWIALRHYGLDEIARLQERTVRITARLYEKLLDTDDFDPFHGPESNILCFRHLPDRLRAARGEAQDAFQAELRTRWNESGEGWITATVLRGRRVLRVTLINPATEESHLDRMIEGLRRIGEGLRE